MYILLDILYLYYHKNNYRYIIFVFHYQMESNLHYHLLLY